MDKDNVLNEGAKKVSQPQGMGLEPSQSNQPSRGSKVKDGAKQAVKNSDRGKKATQGAKKVSEGSAQAAKGATQASAGAGRVAAGDLSGVKDVAKGAVDTVKGAKKTMDGAKDLKDAASKDKEPELNDIDVDGAKGSQLSDPYNADNYDSLFDDDDKDKNDDSVIGDSDDKDGLVGGMKDLLKDDDALDGIEGDNKVSDSGSDDDDKKDFDLKDAAKKLSQVQAANSALTAYAAFQALIKFLKMLYALAQKAIAMLSAVWSAIVGFASSVASAVVGAVTTVASVLGTTVAVAGTIVAGVATAVVTVVVVAVAPEVTNNQAKMDDVLICNPSTTNVSDATLEWADGELSVMKQENIRKSWSVFSEMGVPKEVAAGILGNFSAESGVDPTGVETIYSEPYQIGPKKQAAQNAGFKVEHIDAAYGNRFPGVKLVGIGLGQWSNSRNTQLLDYSASRGLDWFDIGTQLAFMFDADSGRNTLWDIVNTPDITVTIAMEEFLDRWEIPDADARAASYNHRLTEALKIALELDMTEVDTDYAQSIISQMNSDAAEGYHRVSAYKADDGCGDTVGSHIGAPDGTGVFPSTVTGTAWSPATLPDELKPFTYDPTVVGLEYGGLGGWVVNGNEGQCVALSHSYMAKLYGVPFFNGYNGGDMAKGWFNQYGDSLGGRLSEIPQAGAIFEYSNRGIYGHTGVVQHVFANGDLMIVEQNITGISGDNNGTPRTWGWRYIPAAEYQVNTESTYNWQFYKPDLVPNWNGA